jgi:hypothetical protein
MSEIMKCPKCGGELAQGFIQAARGLHWDTEEHKWQTLTSETLLSRGAGPYPEPRQRDAQKADSPYSTTDTEPHLLLKNAHDRTQTNQVSKSPSHGSLQLQHETRTRHVDRVAREARVLRTTTLTSRTHTHHNMKIYNATLQYNITIDVKKKRGGAQFTLVSHHRNTCVSITSQHYI